MENQKDQGSGTGDYGNVQDQENHQGRQSQAAYVNSQDAQQSRGESFDEVQGGGRGADSVSGDPDADQDQGVDPQLDAAADALLGQQAGQDRDRGDVENEDIEQA